MARDLILFKRLFGIISHAQLASGTPVSGYVPIASSGLADDSPAWGPASGVSDILDLPTAETDATLVLAPDGAGGVEFRAESGGGGGGLTPLYTDAPAIRLPDDASYTRFSQGDAGDGSVAYIDFTDGETTIVASIDGVDFAVITLTYTGNILISPKSGGVINLNTSGSGSLVSQTGGDGFVFVNRNSDPSSPVKGQTYFNTVSNKLKTWDGSAWNNLW